jgi:hypothetical protein
MLEQGLEPEYQTDIGGLVEELRRTHGANALDVAVNTAKQYMASSAWKNFAMWLQVVNRLNSVAVTQH